MCKKLQNYVEKGIESMKRENAPGFMLNDYIEEMGTGGAAVCQNCEKYQECFPEDD